MTDNEIIKALECCKSSVASCEECPMHVEGVICHGYELNKKALNLINRQQAEIERLQKYNTEVAYKHYNDGVKEFAERLTENIINTLDKYYNVSCGGYYPAEDVMHYIDNLVKEMVGDTE